MTAGLEPRLRDDRRARGVTRAPRQRPRDTSTRHPLPSNLQPRSPRPRQPDVAIGSTRSRSRTWTSGCPLCCHRRRRQLRSAAPANLPPRYATLDPRPKPRTSRVAPRWRARTRPDTQAGAPQQTITSAHSARCPEPTVPTSPPTRSAPRVRASSPIPNRIARRSDLHRPERTPTGGGPTRAETRASHWKTKPPSCPRRPSDVPVRCCHRATAWLQRKLHSSGTCRPGEPVRRAPEPHTSQSRKQCQAETAAVLPPSQPPRDTCRAEDPQIRRHVA